MMQVAQFHLCARLRLMLFGPSLKLRTTKARATREIDFLNIIRQQQKLFAHAWLQNQHYIKCVYSILYSRKVDINDGFEKI